MTVALSAADTRVVNAKLWGKMSSPERTRSECGGKRRSESGRDWVAFLVL